MQLSTMYKDSEDEVLHSDGDEQSSEQQET